MQKNYLHEKAAKKKSAVKYVWLMLFIGAIFVMIIVKFALSGSLSLASIVTGMPSSDDVYTVAKDFIRPTLKSGDAQFSDSGYQFGKQQDSVYVIRSYVVTKDNAGDDQKTEFEITLRYKGGPATDQKNWELLNINEE